MMMMMLSFSHLSYKLQIFIFIIIATAAIVVIASGQQQQERQQQQNLRSHHQSLSSDPGRTGQDFLTPPPTPLQLRQVHRRQEDDDDDDDDDDQQQPLMIRSTRRNLQMSTFFSSRLQVEFESTANNAFDIPTGDIRLNDGSTTFSEIQTIIKPVLDILVSSYNNINTEDPLNRRVTNVELVSGVVTEVAFSGLIGNRRQRRKLQNFLNFRFILELTGECNGCATDSALTNQETNTNTGNSDNGNGGGRRRQRRELSTIVELMEQQQQQNQNQHRTLPAVGRRPRGGGREQQQKPPQSRQRYLKQDKEMTGGSIDTEVPSSSPSSRPTTLPPTPSPSPPPSPLPTIAPSPAPTPLPTKAPSPAPTPPPSPLPTNEPTNSPTNPPTNPPDPDSYLPTEEELRMAYSTSVMSLNNALIQSVTGLQEIPFTCPYTSNNTPSESEEGIPSLNNQILTKCSPPPMQGYLVLNINQVGSTWCLTTPSDDIGDNLRLQTCDFDNNNNEHSWTILLSSSPQGNNNGNGIMKFQSSIYTDRCIKVGNTGSDSSTIFDGIRLRIGTCDDFNTEFVFDYTTQYLKVANNNNNNEPLLSYCITNSGLSANENDTINARSCPTTTADDIDIDDKYQWSFLFA